MMGTAGKSAKLRFAVATLLIATIGALLVAGVIAVRRHGTRPGCVPPKDGCVK